MAIDEHGANAIKALTSLAWPVVALLSLLAFCSPVREVLDKASDGDVQNFAVGSLSIEFVPSAVATIPALSDEIAEKFEGMSENEILALLAVGESSFPTLACSVEGVNQSFSSEVETDPNIPADVRTRALQNLTRAETLDALVEAGMAKSKPRIGVALDDCPTGRAMAYWLTDTGAKSQTFLQDLITRSISIRSNSSQDKSSSTAQNSGSDD